MKFSVVLFAVLVASACVEKGEASKDLKEIMQTAYKECMEKGGLTMEEIKKAMNQAEPDRKVKCFEACMLEKFEFVNSDGSVNIDKVTQVMAGKDKWIEGFKQCVADAKKGQDKCDAAHELKQCLDKKGLGFGRGKGK